MISELENQTVAIEPAENSVAWAFPLIRWDPEPVLQSYSAYSSSLDALDTRFIQSSAAPSRILQQLPAAIDGRDPFFEPPATSVSVVCHYAQLDASSTWQVLRRVPNRCGSARLITRLTATFGESIQVPPASPGAMVVARIQSLPLSVSYELSALVLKPPNMFMTTPRTTYRFLAETAGDLHLLRPTSSIGYSSQFTPTSIRSFDLNGAGVRNGTGHYVASFYSIHVAAS
jgi:hypothetical protein